ncbi:hypothetical protein C8Q74DRAFT_1025163 [Fomes fomentarius]|nr:hypothetical protein C8Q74DRAFT_1025163 [Fomes fomentarius]
MSTSSDHGTPLNTGDESTESGSLGHPRPYHSPDLLAQCLQGSSPSTWIAHSSRPPNKSTNVNAADYCLRGSKKTLEDGVSPQFAKADSISFVWMMHGANTRTWITAICSSRPPNRGTGSRCMTLGRDQQNSLHRGRIHRRSCNLVVSEPVVVISVVPCSLPIMYRILYRYSVSYAPFTCDPCTGATSSELVTISPGSIQGRLYFIQ